MVNGESTVDIECPRQGGFFHKVSCQSLLEIGRPVSIVQLDHKAGRVDGQDICLSTLIFLLERAEKAIDLVFGCF